VSLLLEERGQRRILTLETDLQQRWEISPYLLISFGFTGSKRLKKLDPRAHIRRGRVEAVW
jgi:hypothetical protein